MTSKAQKKSGWLIPEQITGHDLVCMSIQVPDVPEYRQAVIGAIYSLTKWFNWEKSYTPGDTRAKQAAQYWRDILEINWGCNGMYQLRQNPDNVCQLQQSLDGGETWSLVFDYDLCKGKMTATEWNNVAYTSQNYINEQNAIYDGDITNNVFNWTYNQPTEPTDDNRNYAMAWGCRKFVDWWCDTRIKEIERDYEEMLDELDFYNDLNDILGAISVTAIALIPSGIGVVAAGVIWAAAKVAIFVWGEYNEPDTSPLKSDSAREEVACAIYAAMKDSDPQFSAWKTSLDDFSSSDPDAELIATIITPALQSEDLYVQWLIWLSQMIPISAYLPLPCDQEWSYKFDFTLASYESVFSVIDYGTYSDGVGWVGENVSQTGYDYQIVRIKTGELIERLKHVKMTYTWIGGTWTAPTSYDALWLEKLSSEYTDEQMQRPYSWMSDGADQGAEIGVLGHPYIVRAMLRPSYDFDPEDWGTSIIQQIVMTGEGVNPFLSGENTL